MRFLVVCHFYVSTFAQAKYVTMKQPEPSSTVFGDPTEVSACLYELQTGNRNGTES
jgi:hypothetical protein